MAPSIAVYYLQFNQSFVYKQLNVQTVQFLTIQFYISHSFAHSLSGNEGVLYIHQSSKTRASLYSLMSYPRHLLRWSYPSAEMQSVTGLKRLIEQNNLNFDFNIVNINDEERFICQIVKCRAVQFSLIWFGFFVL